MAAFRNRMQDIPILTRYFLRQAEEKGYAHGNWANIKADEAKNLRGAIQSLAAEVAKLKGAPDRREEAFQKSFAAEKNQGQVLNRKFDELLKQAKENPDFGKKSRDIDL